METIIYQGKTYRVFTLDAFGHTVKVICEPSAYLNRSLAIRMLEIDGEDGQFSPWATLTVNLCAPFQTEKRAYVDTNNNGWAEKFIRTHKLGKKTGINTGNGFCVYPLYEFNIEKFYAKP